MANPNILYSLGKLDPVFKKQYVRSYMAIGPPYLGSYKASRSILSGNSEMIALDGALGFHYDA